MKAMRKLLVVLPVLLALAGGCDATRRDFTVCDHDYRSCSRPDLTCNYATGRCEPFHDAATPDILASDAGPVDLSESEAALAPDAADAPSVVDVSPVDTTSLDTGVVDAPIVDVSIPDTRVPDAAGTCAVDNDCFGVTSGSNCVNNKCVACKASSQCNNDAGVPFCSAQNTCVSCAGVSGPDGGGACPATAPVCAATGSCVECVSNGDCPTAGKAFCVQNKCQGCNVPGATASVPVSSGVDGGAIDGGAIDSGAPDAGASVGPCTGATPVCATTGTIAGQCVGCVTITNDGGVTSSNCTGATPICNTIATPAIGNVPAIPAYTCVACTSDTQCADKGVGPGVCMFHQDGRCASDAETIYVQNSATCSGGAGTIASPYCDSQAGINAVTASKRVIVMSGANLYPVTSTATSSTGQITIIGQSTATTTAGAFVGIHVTAGDVYVRGLTIPSGTNAGLTVDAGATLRMDRCIVKGNVGGGLIVKSGANFDIANSVFDNNGPGLVGTTTTFGGIYLGGSAPSAGPHRFWFNTVVNNQDRGIICFDATQALTGMLLYGNTNGDFLSCAMDATSKWSSGSPTPSGASSDITNPALSSTYHLTTASKCRDFVSASTAHPVDDMDGELRPKPANGKLDCGADEF
jgi:hypothetical protein